ncbi:AfsR/SARP family transcriptional regulator [Streptomyces sp. TG1A-8]|uniref:AfsR/SARP family transcriptional regulator n=1 Tax=Streptomyces sp. TG1A-8 TaxID=3051385 RepID=UPI00265BB30C|nr:AfsR/SARP family transcriptional regulator [Streptomyces sp. TG1A-8]MDO0924263.1 AfsR/SARP family transcriptional regulator [Streptomyces sp. TG1A-8]
MDFRLLGPLEIRAGDQVSTVGGARQRTLLAILLVDSGRLLSVDQLYGELWGEAPPPTMGNSLQAHVYRLRRTLQQISHPTAGPRLLNRSSGYVLELNGATVDTNTFHQTVSRARARMYTDPVAAHALFKEALSLWQGEPFQGIAQGPRCRSIALQLKEEYLTALEDKLSLDIDIADPVRTIGELKRMSAAHPWRERIIELLMLALYRAGRQAEALETYYSTRRRLVEELGIEPSVQLRELLREILAQETRTHRPAFARSARVPVTSGN